MGLYEMWATIVALIVIGLTVSSVVDTLNPRPVRNLNKFDAIDEELQRLHEQAEESPSLRGPIYEQINTLNQALIAEKDESKTA